jgi:eukaryotic translation initiation factor 2C
MVMGESNTSAISIRPDDVCTGGDVSHPPPGSRGHPSVSAVVGSVDINSCQYAAESHVQASREERIVNLKQITISLVKTFATANKNTPPGHILFFR